MPAQNKKLNVFKKPVLIMFILGLLFVLLNIAIINRVRAYSSDDTAWQATVLTWRPADDHIAYFGSDPFILKLPYYLIINALFTPGREVLFATSLLFTALNFAFLYYAYIYFLKSLKVRLSYYSLLPVLWFASFGHWFSSLFLNPNLRNFELGLTFFFIAIIFKIYAGELKPLKSKLSVVTSLLGCLLISVTIVNDLYFLYFGVVPVAIFVALLTFLRRPYKDRRTGLLILGGLSLSFILSKIIHLIVIRTGIDMIESAGNELVSASLLPRKAYGTLKSTGTIFNADFWNNASFSFLTAAEIINALIVCAVIIYTLGHLYVVIRRKKLNALKDKSVVWQLFYTFFLLLVLAVYTVTTSSNGVDTYRYLVIAPFILLFLVTGITVKVPKEHRKKLCAFLVISTLLNFYITLHYNRTALFTGGNPNQANLNIINELKSRGFTKGYANYWDGNINTYLSKGDVDFLPITCTDKAMIAPFRWLMDGDQFQTQSETSFIMIDPRQINTELCTETNLISQFGTPAERIMLEGRYIYTYNYDVVIKFN